MLASLYLALCIFFMHLLQLSSSILSNNNNYLQHSQATLDTKLESNIFLTLYWTLSQWNYHNVAASGSVGQCMHDPAVNCFFAVNIYFLQ